MHWYEADYKDLPGITEFVTRYEYLSVSLSSRLVDRKGTVWPEKARFFLLIHDEDLIGVVYLNSLGLVLPLLPAVIRPEGKLPPISGLPIKSKRVHTVIGSGKAVETILGIVPEKRKAVHYRLMISPRKPIPLPGTGACPGRLRKASASDAFRLFRLQEGYEKEEVLLNPDLFNRQRSINLFKKSLREQITFYCEIDGVPAAKASTNAVGFNWCQLGGVYTLPELRNRGLGRAVVSRLCAECAALGFRSVLFVKSGNAPAENLYRRLGFEVYTDYRILYAV